MKYFAGILFSFLFITGSAQTIQGKLANIDDGQIYFYYSYDDIFTNVDTVRADIDGNFSRQFRFSKMGNVVMSTSNVNYTFIVFPESRLTVDADASNFEKFNATFKIQGAGAEYNNSLLLQQNEQTRKFKWDYDLPAERFVMNLSGWRLTRDSIRKAIVNNPIFKNSVANNFKYLKVDSINDLYWTVGAMRDYHYFTLKGVSETDSFFQKNVKPHVFSTEDEDYLAAPQYINFWDRYITNKYDWKKGTADSVSVNAETWMEYRFEEPKKLLSGKLQTIVIAQLIQNSFAYNYRYMSEDIFPIYDSIIEKYGREIENPAVLAFALNAIQEVKEMRKKTSKGSVAAPFSLIDRNNKMTDLESYKGKIVYLDIWASWCAPCIGEFPDYKKLVKQFKAKKDVVFISVSIDDSKSKWIGKGLTKYQPPGIQLWGGKGGAKSQFAKSYFISGIPQYILIDRLGKILNYNAARPSSGKKIQKEIEDAIKL